MSALRVRNINESWLIVPVPPISANMHCCTANCLAPVCLLTYSQDMKKTGVGGGEHQLCV